MNEKKILLTTDDNVICMLLIKTYLLKINYKLTSAFHIDFYHVIANVTILSRWHQKM